MPKHGTNTHTLKNNKKELRKRGEELNFSPKKLIQMTS